MSSDEKSLSDLSALEAALASLAPRADRLDRDRLMFLAGQASVTPPSVVPVAAASPRLRIWQAAFAAMTAVAAGLFVAFVVRPGPQVVQRISPMPPESSRASPIQQERKPAASPDVPAPAQIAEGSERLESSPAWPFEPLLLGRADWRHRQLAHTGLFHHAYARLLEQGPADGVGATKQPAGAGDELPATAPPPASYRELLRSLLKETGTNTGEGES